MRESYFGKMIRHIKNVYHVDKVFNDLTDRRVYPKYKTSCTVMSSIGNGPKIVFDFEMNNPQSILRVKTKGSLMPPNACWRGSQDFTNNWSNYL